MNWYIGQNVVAIKDCFFSGKKIVEKGSIYTISAFGFQPETITHYSYNFIELVGLEDYRWFEASFRPLEENFAEKVLKTAIERAEEIEQIIEIFEKHKI